LDFNYMTRLPSTTPATPLGAATHSLNISDLHKEFKAMNDIIKYNNFPVYVHYEKENTKNRKQYLYRIHSDLKYFWRCIKSLKLDNRILDTTNFKCIKSFLAFVFSTHSLMGMNVLVTYIIILTTIKLSVREVFQSISSINLNLCPAINIEFLIYY